MPPRLVDVRTPAPSAPSALLTGYAALVLEVADLDRARRFYEDVLGHAPSPAAAGEGIPLSGPEPRSVRFALGQQELILHETPNPRTLPDCGAHFALRTPEEALARLAAAGVELFSYREDRPAERDHNRYCLDPDGNRLQLVLADAWGIDHAAVETHDVEWAEAFYTHVLGGVVETRVGWRMDDYIGALAWGEGQDQCAPGTRRWDRRYTTIEGNARVARPNAHFFVTFGTGVTLGVYLATEHRQEPPPGQFVGTPRISFTAASIDEVEGRLRNIRLRCMYSSPETGGPFERHAAALYVRDPGGNFLELRETQA